MDKDFVPWFIKKEGSGADNTIASLSETILSNSHMKYELYKSMAMTKIFQNY